MAAKCTVWLTPIAMLCPVPGTGHTPTIATSNSDDGDEVQEVFEFGEYIHCACDGSESETIILRGWLRQPLAHHRSSSSSSSSNRSSFGHRC